MEVKHLCRRMTLKRFAKLQQLFLNINPECLVQAERRHGETLDYIHEVGINPDRVIIKLT